MASASSNPRAGDHVWTQWYCTQASTERVGSIVFVLDAVQDPPKSFIVAVKQGTKPFPTLETAEGWLQSRIKSGSQLVKC